MRTITLKMSFQIREKIISYNEKGEPSAQLLKNNSVDMVLYTLCLNWKGDIL